MSEIMTDKLWQMLEEKMMTLVADNERLHKENATMRFEREENAKRIYNLLSLVESVVTTDDALMTASLAAQQPIVIQG